MSGVVWKLLKRYPTYQLVTTFSLAKKWPLKKANRAIPLAYLDNVGRLGDRPMAEATFLVVHRWFVSNETAAISFVFVVEEEPQKKTNNKDD